MLSLERTQHLVMEGYGQFTFAYGIVGSLQHIFYTFSYFNSFTPHLSIVFRKNCIQVYTSEVT